jgi:ketosteroid isomerase-like protein
MLRSWSFKTLMNRFIFCLLAVFSLCCAAAAQTSSSDPAPSSVQEKTPAGVTSTVSPEIAQFQKIEDSWSDSVNRRDQYGLELVLSPLFVDVSATGDVTTRNQQVAQVLSGEDKTLYLTQKVVTVRMLGDIAVANGTYTLHHKVGSGQVDEKGIFTQVFERAHGGWLCINSQRTVLRQDTGAKQKKAATNETPFRFPLFTKTDKGPQ